VAAVRTAVRAALADLPPGTLVLVACSGGPDSLALAAGTAFVATKAGLLAGAVVIDHGWRPDSAAVSRRAADACVALGLDPVEVVEVTGDGGGGPEAAARDARYAALDQVAAASGAGAVLLGHTLDDQAETVLLGLARGAGARSLAGMPANRGLYRRPLLGLRRKQTVRACAALGLQPWQDPANADPGYARVRVRSAMSTLEEALGPGLTEALARTADLLAEDADALDAAAADLLAAARTAGAARAPDGLDVAVLAAAPTAIRRRALLVAARAAGCPPGALSRRHAVAVDALITAWRGQGQVDLPGGPVARRVGPAIVIGR
jgi:tRNA(Ile)-lysidine synthetase-like protein